MKRPKLLAVGGAHIDRRGQVSGVYVPGASNPGHDARGCRRRRLQRAAQRRAARRRGVADVGARRRCGRRQRRPRHRPGQHPRSLRRVPRPRDAELHGADRPRRRRDRRPRRHGALRDRVPQAAAPRARRATRSPTPTPSFATPTCRPPRWSGWRHWPTASRCSPSPSRRPRRCGWRACSAASRCLFMNRREAAALAGAPQDATPASLRRRLARGGPKRAASSRQGSAAVTGFDADGIFSIVPPCLAVDGRRQPAPAMRWPARRRPR